MILNGSPYNGHAQSCTATPHFFPGVKRFKYLAQNFGGHAHAAVLNRQNNIVSRRNFLVRVDWGLKPHVLCHDKDPASVLNRFKSINHQVHNRFLQMNR